MARIVKKNKDLALNFIVGLVKKLSVLLEIQRTNAKKRA